MPFPAQRMRRLRAGATLRRMVRETQLAPDDFIYPLFVVHGQGVRREIGSMPGVFNLSVDEAVAEAQEVYGLGIPAVILFGLPQHKDPIGLENFAPEGIVQQAIRAIKKAVPELVVITDVCLCEYTDHGHCFVIREGRFDNDATLEILGKVVVSHAQAGADIVAPSGMVDGMIATIRSALDREGFSMTGVMSYAVKYASGFYGPFREAADSAPAFGDRHSYQMDPANAREALREARLDVEEGADVLMVKPGLPYLDVLRRVREAFDLPLAAYNVSGEYSMVKAAALNGWLDERRVVLETLTAFKRAGADLILTYHAKDAACWLREG
ncbi:porphobilinogen synthase [Calidithermus roseus]|uniref:Delta-aminolevulinic acid dehydratase n=1 Tax=Calidithermus roseus TaxID=1644118 RepID=A0A399EWF7_9DEIN|nr:porphobilinogen synthase [Calidithermus roseus]RIH88358.1 Delta-aminolevulinic acid dehydratase [Calidithermus roseus]